MLSHSFDIWHSLKQWSNADLAIQFVEKVICENDQGREKPSRTTSFGLKDLQILPHPNGCTEELQSLDLGII